MGFKNFVKDIQRFGAKKPKVSMLPRTYDESDADAFVKIMSQTPEELEAEFIRDLQALNSSTTQAEELTPAASSLTDGYKKLTTDVPVRVSRSEAETAASKLIPVYARQDFETIRLLGKGAMGKVFLALNTRTEKFEAFKIIPKAGLSTADRALFYKLGSIRERLLDCPWTIDIKDVFEDSKNFYVVSEYYSGNSLQHRLLTSGSLSEQAAQLVAAELIVAIESIRARGITFHDLKLDNILIDENGHIKLSGLQHATFSGEHFLERQHCISAISGATPHSEGCQPFYEVDTVSIGAVICTLLRSHTLSGYAQDSQTNEYGSLGLSSPAQDIIAQQPITLAALKAHSFFDTINWDDVGARINTGLHREVYRYSPPEFINMWDVPPAGHPISSEPSHPHMAITTSSVKPKRKNGPRIVQLAPYNPLMLPYFNLSLSTPSSPPTPALSTSSSSSIPSDSSPATPDVAHFESVDVDIRSATDFTLMQSNERVVNPASGVSTKPRTFPSFRTSLHHIQGVTQPTPLRGPAAEAPFPVSLHSGPSHCSPSISRPARSKCGLKPWISQLYRACASSLRRLYILWTED